MAYDAIIIGAGMSGLAAGIRLAMFEKSVLILERHSLPGGLNSWYRKDGIVYDVGLHAMTNFVPKRTPRAPLTRLLKQLRIPYDSLDLVEQKKSAVAFPGRKLEFDNDFNRLADSVREVFPHRIDNFMKLAAFVREHNNLDLTADHQPSRRFVESYLGDPLLADMILCPLIFYGSAATDDIDLNQFVTMFQSIYMEGFARPRDGVRVILDLLLNRYREEGGELRFLTGVKELVSKNGAVSGVVTDAGDVIEADCVLSSAGLRETFSLIPDSDKKPKNETLAIDVDSNIGHMTFVETIGLLDTPASELGIDTTILFFCNTERFRYHPSDGRILDTDSGLVCCPDNYRYDTPLPVNMVRVTNISAFDSWINLSGEEYARRKETAGKLAHETAVRHIPDYRAHLRGGDLFTPKTIHRYTGHENGAIYGAPVKARDGRTGYDNLYIIGTDQGFLGIVGAILSGISIANLYGLK